MASNLPFGFDEHDEEKIYDELDYDFTDDEYLIPEKPYLGHLDTEDKNFEQE